MLKATLVNPRAALFALSSLVRMHFRTRPAALWSNKGIAPKPHISEARGSDAIPLNLPLLVRHNVWIQGSELKLASMSLLHPQDPQRFFMRKSLSSGESPEDLLIQRRRRRVKALLCLGIQRSLQRLQWARCPGFWKGAFGVGQRCRFEKGWLSTGKGILVPKSLVLQ